MTLFTFLAAETAAAGPIQEIATQFGVDWWKLISQMISFSIVVFVLNKYAYQPILDVLAERRQKIAEGLANAEESRKQLASAQQQATEILTKANLDAQKVIDDAKAAAKTLQDRETQRASMEAEQIINKAKQAAEREHAKMLATLKKQVARLVVDTTTKVTGRVLTDDDQKRLSEEAAREVAA
jgi:F-type H+-transporting ATPase subunit b